MFGKFGRGLLGNRTYFDICLVLRYETVCDVCNVRIERTTEAPVGCEWDYEGILNGRDKKSGLTSISRLRCEAIETRSSRSVSTKGTDSSTFFRR